MLYKAFILHSMEPGYLMGLRERNDKITRGERAFIFACIRKSLIDGETPVQIKNLSGKKSDKGGG